MNYIQCHDKISNDDYLFTLSMFVVEPDIWIRQHDWRELIKVEQDALYYLWKEVGEGMGIKDIPESFDALCEWSWEYERKHMRYAATNEKVVAPTVDMILNPLPNYLRPLVRSIVPALMSDRLAEATGFPKAKPWAKMAIRWFFVIRAFFLKYFFLPRWSSNQRTAAGPLNGPNGRRRLFKPNWNLYGCTYPDGYDIASLGPKKMRPGKTCPLFKAADSGPRRTKD